MQTQQKGLTIALSPQVAAQLRGTELPENNMNDHDADAGQELAPLFFLGGDQHSDRQQHPENESFSQKDHHPTDQSFFSLPTLCIDVEKLVGYIPESEQECIEVRDQLLSAMWTRFQEDEQKNDKATTTTIEDAPNMSVPPPTFDQHCTDLLEAGVATYATSKNHLQEKKEAAAGRLYISYPSQLLLPPDDCASSSTTSKLLPTVKAFEAVQTNPRPDLEFVDRLWIFLQQCSKQLSWKFHFANELTDLIAREQDRLDAWLWEQTKRQEGLEHLYQVRETIYHQMEISKTSLEVLEEDRETKVNEVVLLNRRQATNGGSSIGLEYFGKSDLTFPDEFQLLGLRGDEESEDEYYSSDPLQLCSSDEESASTYSDYSNDADYSDHHLPERTDSGENQAEPESNTTDEAVLRSKPCDLPKMSPEETATVATATNNSPTLLEPFKKRKQRRAKAKRMKAISKKEDQKAARKAKLKAIEDEARAQHTTTEVILAQTLYRAMKGKVQQVDELLEEMQDAVWEAEEKKELTALSNTDEQVSYGKPKAGMSLVDQMLAMILGSLPKQAETSSQDHYAMIQREHASIVEEWKSYFGRLPRAADLR